MINVTKAIRNYIKPIVKYDFNIIPVLAGNPGISKTKQLHQIAKEENWGILPVHLALRPIESLSGIPDIIKNDDTFLTKWSAPEIITMANELASKHEKVILFFDDIHLADKSRQAYFFELATERAIQGHKLADNVKIICAGNTTTKAGAKTFLSAIVNRFSFIEVDISTKDWLSWAMNKSQKYKDVKIHEDLLEKNKAINIHPLIISLIQHKETLLTSEEDTQPFASPRSWEIMSEWLKLFEVVYGSINNWHGDIYRDLQVIALGTIGKAANDLIQYAKYLGGVDIDKIIKNPIELTKISNVEKRIAVLYNIYTMLGEEKYRKYILKWIDFTFYVLGEGGNSPHFTSVLLNILNQMDITYMYMHRNFDMFEKTENIKTPKDIIDKIYNSIGDIVIGA